MAYYVRVGNRTVTKQELQFISPEQIQKMKDDGEAANQKRLENMRKGLGMEPQKVTLDVTPKGVAARKEAIAAEEAKLATETEAIEKDLGDAVSTFVDEGEKPSEAAEEIKKPRGKKSVA